MFFVEVLKFVWLCDLLVDANMCARFTCVWFIVPGFVLKCY